MDDTAVMAGPNVPRSAACAVLVLRLALGLILVDAALGRILGWDRWSVTELDGRLLAATAPWVLLVLGGLLVLGLFTYGATLAAAATLLVLHAVALENAASKLHMWSNLLFTGACSALLFLSQEDRLAVGRWLRRHRAWARAARVHFGPAAGVDRFDAVRLVLRLALGCDFLAAGWSKLEHPWVAGMVAQFRSSFVPQPVIEVVATALPFLQLLLGAALVVGLFTLPAACALGFVMLLLVAGQLILGASLFSLWSMFIYLLAIVAVLCLPGPNRWSLDHVLRRLHVRARSGNRNRPPTTATAR